MDRSVSGQSGVGGRQLQHSFRPKGTAICDASFARSRGRTECAGKGTLFKQLFNRLKPKIEAKGAVWAVAHRIAKVIWLMLAHEVDYIEKGPAPPNQRTLMRKLRRLARDFALLGIDINKAALASV